MAYIRRRLRRPRNPFATKGEFGYLCPLGWSVIFPNETLEHLTFDTRFLSLPLEFSVGGATVDVWSFYVPYALIWPDYYSAIMPEGDPPSYPTTPRNTVADPPFFQTADQSHCALPRWAYGRVVDDFFRREKDEPYPNNIGTMAPLPVVDMTFEHRLKSDDASVDVELAITDNKLSMEKLDNAMSAFRKARVMDLQTNNYAAYLRMWGVNNPEKLNQDVELVAHHRKFIYPKMTVDEGSGRTVQSFAYGFRQDFKKPRYFEEHGLLLHVASIRPKVVLAGVRNLCEFGYDARHWPTPEPLWLAGGEGVSGEMPASLLGLSDDAADYAWTDPHFYGRHFTRGMTGDSVKTYSATTPTQLSFPTNAWAQFVDATTKADWGADWIVDGVVSHSIRTPLKEGKQEHILEAMP